MKSELASDDGIVITVTTEKQPSLMAVAQFLSGVAIMREALSLGKRENLSQFEARLRGITSPLLALPAPLIEACGSTWALLGDWPPMDRIFRGGMVQALLEVCDHANAPRFRSIQSGSLKCFFDKLFGSSDTDESRDVALAESLDDSTLLFQRSQRVEFKDRMLARLNAKAPSGPAALFAPLVMPFGPRRPEMLAAGTMMFACQSLEESYTAMGAREIRVEGVARGRDGENPKRPRRPPA